MRGAEVSRALAVIKPLHAATLRRGAGDNGKGADYDGKQQRRA